MENEIMNMRSSTIIAAEINTIKQRTKREILSASIEIGQRLCEAKELVNHGEWQQWLHDQVDYSQSTAENLMRIYHEYGDDQIDLISGTSKSQTFKNLTYSQALALFALPADERVDFVKQNNIEDMSSRELAEAIKAKEEAEKRANKAIEAKEKLENELSGTSKLLTIANEGKDKLQQALHNAENDKADTEEKLSSEIQQLRDEIAAISEVKPAAPSPEELEKLRTEVMAEVEEEYKKRTDQLTFEKQSVENEKAEIKEDYENRLKKLKLDNESILERQKAAEKKLAAAAPEAQKIDALCGNIQQNFDSISQLLKTLNQNGNHDMADKLRGLVKKLFASMAEKLSQ